MESQARKMRSKFFSSCAHELRTPLNSILPILLIVIQMLMSGNFDINLVIKYLKIMQNSSTHLENVIEDALDISRIENGKFEINKSEFNFRNTVNEVADIMKFQLEQKKLQFLVLINNNVPVTILSDLKRFK